VVWLKIPEEAVKADYERDAALDPYNYQYSSAPTVDPSNVVRRFQINMPKISPRAKKKNHLFFLKNPQHKRSAS
jgi:hypothetical protein